MDPDVSNPENAHYDVYLSNPQAALLLHNTLVFLVGTVGLAPYADITNLAKNGHAIVACRSNFTREDAGNLHCILREHALNVGLRDGAYVSFLFPCDLVGTYHVGRVFLSFRTEKNAEHFASEDLYFCDALVVVRTPVERARNLCNRRRG